MKHIVYFGSINQNAVMLQNMGSPFRNIPSGGTEEHVYLLSQIHRGTGTENAVYLLLQCGAFHWVCFVPAV